MASDKNRIEAQAIESKWVARRKKIPVMVLRAVFIECGHKCANPHCRFSLILEAHHILWVKDGGDNVADNLLALCPNCHAEHTRGATGYDTIWHWKQMLVTLNSAYDKHGMDQLLFLHKTAHWEIWCDGGAIERYAALIGVGLAEITATRLKREPGVGISHTDGGSHVEAPFTTSSHTISLTQRGRLLVDAWLSKDHKKYKSLFNVSLDCFPDQ